jgi:hypothetical protein
LTITQSFPSSIQHNSSHSIQTPDTNPDALAVIDKSEQSEILLSRYAFLSATLESIHTSYIKWNRNLLLWKWSYYKKGMFPRTHMHIIMHNVYSFSTLLPYCFNVMCQMNFLCNFQLNLIRLKHKISKSYLVFFKANWKSAKIHCNKMQFKIII